MTTPSVNSCKLSVRVRIGICRDKNCQHYGSFGVRFTNCPGNHCYETRGSRHYYERIETKKEMELYNSTDHSRLIGCCDRIDCFTVGMKGMICSRCYDRKEYRTFKDFTCQNQVEPIIGFYTKGAIDRRIVPMKSLFGPLPLTTYALPESAVVDGNTSGIDMSFYTPSTDDDDNIVTTNAVVVTPAKKRSAD